MCTVLLTSVALQKFDTEQMFVLVNRNTLRLKQRLVFVTFQCSYTLSRLIAES